MFGAAAISNPKMIAPVCWAWFRSFSESGPTPVLTIYTLNWDPIIFSASVIRVSSAPAYDALMITG